MKMRRILSIILCALMVLAIVPASIFMTSAAAGDVNTIYHNDFTNASAFTTTAGGSVSGAEATTQDGFTDAGMKLNGGNEWKEVITLDNNTGAIAISMFFYNNNFNTGTYLSINGVALLTSNNGHAVIDGETITSGNSKAYRNCTITVDIADPSTGVATVDFRDSYGNGGSKDVNVGAISDTMTVTMGKGGNSFKVDDIKVTQVEAETSGGGEPEEPGELVPTTLYSNDFSASVTADGAEVGAESQVTLSNGKVAFAGWNNNAWWSKSVALDGTGLVTIKADIYPNMQQTAPYISVNGTAIVSGAGGSKVQLAGAASTYNSATNAVVYVTITIDPATGDGTVNYVQNQSGYTDRSSTFNIGAVGSELTLKLGYGINGWSADNVSISQMVAAPAIPEIEIQGVQQTETVDGLYSVRFIATGNVLTNVTAVGFEVEVAGKKLDLTTSQVYKSLKATYGTEIVTAESYGADYITGIAITNIPASEGVLEFTVKPYVLVEGSADKQYGATGIKTITPKDEAGSAPSFESEFTVAANGSKNIQLNTADFGDTITVTFAFAQNGTTSGGAGMAAALFNIDNNLAIRVTGGAATHVASTSAATQHSNAWWGYQGGDYPNTTVSFKAVINVAANTITYCAGWDLSEPNVNEGTISGFDFSDGVIDLNFGTTKDISISFFTVE